MASQQAGSRGRQLALIVASRACANAGMSVVAMGGASDSLLKSLCGGDEKRVQRIQAWLQSAGTAMDFVWVPLSAALIDCYGRWPALFGAQLGVLLLRLAVARCPSVLTYCLYRLGQRLLLRMSMPAAMAAYADLLGGRGSAKFVRVHQRIDAVLSLVRLAGLPLGGRLKDDTTNFRVAAGLNAAACLLLLGVGETLQPSKRMVVNWQRAHPLAWVSFFNSTPRLRRLGVAVALHQATAANTTQPAMVRGRFGWGKKQWSDYQFVGGLLQLPFQLGGVTGVVLDALGHEGAARWSDRLGVAQALLSCCAPQPQLLHACHALEIARHGGTAVEREVALEAKGMGYASTGAALSALGLPLQLVLPPIFADMFAWVPALPSAATAALRIINSEIVLPWAFAAPEEASRHTRPRQ
eukprot:TRINITY_DN65182_c0_g1_i1.p1 TRINITY_DN65182_c0_g1~~TRINITY_DN65182_c0_g1_i1.p1  ORF type:complete len:411 (+),score=133.33 TRINITY_DN65182_c0_g1_i1:86-1318(+)